MRAAGLARRVFSTEGVRDTAVLTFVAILGGGAATAIQNFAYNTVNG